jgi:hypothetical protein
MQVLYDLVHSLSKDEKRIFRLRQRQQRFQPIYDGYLTATNYSRETDREIYRAHFSEVSRAYYSMQKRELLDELLALLLERTNNQRAEYAYMRSLSKAYIMRQRALPDGALMYLKEAYEQSHRLADPVAQQQVIAQIRDTLPATENPSMAEYEQWLNAEHELVARQHIVNQVKNCKIALEILLLNAERTPQEVVQQKALAYISQLRTLAERIEDDELYFEQLTCEELFARLNNDPDALHCHLVNEHKATNDQTQRYRYLRLTNLLMRSAVQVGDFLLLSGLIYKLDKQLHLLTEPERDLFLPDYWEACALYHFYENDLPLAIKEINFVLERRELDPETLLRCTFYRLAMLLAAYLSHHIPDEIKQYRQRIPGLESHPLLWVVQAMVTIESGKGQHDLQLDIDRQLLEIKGSREYKTVADNLQIISAYLQGKRPRLDAVSRLYPTEWEDILRVDLFLEAKLHNKFYYNLILENWHSRRKVFSC